MITNLIVIDDFYQEPDEVRQFALQQEFNVSGNYPGLRTQSFLNDNVKNAIQHLVYSHAGRVLDWGGEYTGAFQIATSADRTWIHADKYTTWAGVCYLTPDAPLSAGTAFYQHNEKGIYKDDGAEYPEGQDYTKWTKTDVIANRYNRLILYRGDIFHASLDYFGYNLETGRLFQTFFFTTEG